MPKYFLLCMLKAVKADEAKMAFINQFCHFELATGNLPQNNVQELSEEKCKQPSYYKMQGFPEPILWSSAEICQEQS